MNQELLAQLNDIQTPEPIGVWPLAWGWWVLIILTLILLFLTIKLVRQRIKQLKAKKQALKLLKQAQNLPPIEKISAVNQILKRAALAYLPRTQVAKLNGIQWANWLNQFRKDAQISTELLILIYQSKCSEEQANLYYLQAQQWLNKVLPLSAKSLSLVESDNKTTAANIQQGAEQNV